MKQSVIERTKKFELGIQTKQQGQDSFFAAAQVFRRQEGFWNQIRRQIAHNKPEAVKSGKRLY